MKPALLIAFGVVLAAFAPALISAPAQAKTMKECAAEWDKMKAAKQTGGMKKPKERFGLLKGKPSKKTTKHGAIR